MRKALVTLLPAVITGIFSFAGIYFATVYTQSNSFQNKRQEALLEIEKKNYEKTQKFYRRYLEFADLCLKLTTYRKSGDLMELQLPSIASDTILKSQWIEKKDELLKLKDSIDYRVYYSFESILHVYENNPFPNIEIENDIKSNHWYTNKLSENWISEAGYLKHLVNKKLNLELEESYY